MEKSKLKVLYLLWIGLGGLLVYPEIGYPADSAPEPYRPPQTQGASTQSNREKILYPKKTELKFDGAQIEGELQNPGEFYFQHRPEGKFDSLVKRRKNFHREMMRDVIFSK